MFSASPRMRATVNSLTGGSFATIRWSRRSLSKISRASHSKTRSSARLRALVLAAITGHPLEKQPSGTDATEVAAVAGVDLDLLAGRDEQRHADLMSGLEAGRLGAAGGAVALQTGLGVLHQELDRRRKLDVEHPALVRDHDGLLILEQEVGRITNELGSHLDLVEGAQVLSLIHISEPTRRTPI